MKHGRKLVGCALIMVAMMVAAAQAELVDRTIAVVNRHLITWSDLDEQMRFEALENARPLKDLGPTDRHEVFEHIVQYRILHDQMQGAPPAGDSEVDARIVELRAGWHVESDNAKWVLILSRYGITADELRVLVKNQIEILKFMEFRVRPMVRVTRQEVDNYYSLTLVPQVVAAGQTPEPVEEVTPKIRELLTEQKMNQEIEKWLQTLRAQSSVQVIWDAVR
jgi:ABC-type lipoprotein release transport system permease subunit